MSPWLALSGKHLGIIGDKQPNLALEVLDCHPCKGVNMTVQNQYKHTVAITFTRNVESSRLTNRVFAIFLLPYLQSRREDTQTCDLLPHHYDSFFNLFQFPP